MAAAHYTIEVRVVGTYQHGAGVAVAFVFDHEPNVIHLAFGEE